MDRSRILCLVFACLLPGCAFFRILSGSDLKKPSFAYARYEMTGMDETRSDLRLHLKAKNPNAIGLRNVFISYELFSEGKRFLRGDSIAVELIPNGETPLQVPVQVIYLDVLRAAGPAAEKILAGAKTLPVTVVATLTGRPTVYNESESGSLFAFTVDLSHTFDVPIPREAAEKAAGRQIRKGLRKMF
jgi:hypothetical protein